MKTFLVYFFMMHASSMIAQTKVTKYYDADWNETPKEKAEYYADFIKDGSVYNCTSYWINTTQVRGKSIYRDTSMAFPIGLQILYNKNGGIEDSIYTKDLEIQYYYHFYPNGQLGARYFLKDNSKAVSEAFDESGKKIKDYIFQRKAEFKSGLKGWTSYLARNSADNLFAKGKEDVSVIVSIQFVIDENGHIIDPKIFTSSGYKNVDNDALKIIKNSPPWKYAILHNRPVKEMKIQPLVYTLKGQK